MGMAIRWSTASQLRRNTTCTASRWYSSSSSSSGSSALQQHRLTQQLSRSLDQPTVPKTRQVGVCAAVRRSSQHADGRIAACNPWQTDPAALSQGRDQTATRQHGLELLLALAAFAVGAAVLQPDCAWAQAAQHTAHMVQQSADAVQGSAQAASQEGSASAGLLRFLMEDSKALGGLAPVGYLAGVAGFELLPIFAPRPIAPISGFLFGVLRLRLWLSLLAGLIFGPLQGAALNLAGTTGAAAVAFAKARRDEGPQALLQQIEQEDPSGTVRKVYERIKGVIDSGSLAQQASVITVLRIVPFAPFRAISYYLGLTPIRFSAYIAGTTAGRGFWALLYASIGAYSRTWMQRGIGLDGVLQELGEAAGLYTTEAIVTGVVLSLSAAGGWGLGVVGPNAPGLPEEGHYADRLRERRDIAKDGAVGLARQLVPSDEWLTGSFWRQTAQKAKAAGQRVVDVLLDDGEGDLDDWLTHKGEDSPLRAQAAKALQAVKSGAEQIGLDPRTLRKQAKVLGEKLDGQGRSRSSNGSEGSEQRSHGSERAGHSRQEQDEHK